MKSSGKPGKMLLVQTASIGDVILITPVLEAMHSKYPDCEIDVLLKKGNETLFTNHPFIRKVLVWNKTEKKYAHLRELIKAIRSERYDLLINFQRFFSTGLLTLLSKANFTVGFNKNPLSSFFSLKVKHLITTGLVHETERNLNLISDWVEEAEGRPVLYPSIADFAKVSQYKTQAYICIAPASLWFTKQYPEEKWIEFIANIPSQLSIYLIGGSSDKALCERIVKQAKHPRCLSLTGALSLLETAALMRDAGMNYVNDSAPLHLASAMNAHICAIFCSTVPAFGFLPSEPNFLHH